MTVRHAAPEDIEDVRRIYNEGIEDRCATLDENPKSRDDIAQWWSERTGRYCVLVAVEEGRIVGWASLNPFSHRCAHAAIADLSVYVARASRGRGVGAALLAQLDAAARLHGFRKIVLHALDANEPGKRLYRKSGFAEVGVFKRHGLLDGAYVDVVAMEKLLE
jgi:phosphinothricin acetyltransferase